MTTLAQVTDSLQLGIIDIVLPDGSGSELIQSIQGIHPGMAVIVISGYLKANR